MNCSKPYYIVTFFSELKANALGYTEMSDLMLKLSKEQDGFLGVESVRDSAGRGITVSYWKDLESIQKWKNHPEHLKAQERGKSDWYASYSVEISRVL